MVASNPKLDPAGAWLEAHGERMHQGQQMVVKKSARIAQSATELADSPPQIKGNTKGRQGKGINLRKVAEVLEEHGLDPTEEIVKVLPDLDESLKAKVLLELLNYCQPKLKAIEHSGPNGDPMQHVGTFNINFSGKK